MKTLLTLLALCGSFYAGTHYVVTPRLDEAKGQCQAKPAKRVARASKAGEPAKAKADRFDPGY